jgi:hypothetical protein
MALRHRTPSAWMRFAPLLIVEGGILLHWTAA